MLGTLYMYHLITSYTSPSCKYNYPHLTDEKMET